MSIPQNTDNIRINYGASLHLKGTALYVVPLSMQILPAILLFFFMMLNQESPRFLAKQDRWEEAKKILSLVRNLPESHPYVETEFQEIVTVIERERILIGGANFKALMREMWLIPGNRKRALISVGLMICQQMTGTNALNYYAPQIFKTLGVTGTNAGLFATGIYGVVKMTACASFLLLAADSLGRRRSLLWTSIAQGTAMYYIAIYVRVSPPDTTSTDPKPPPPAGYVSLVAIYLFAAFFQFGWGAVCWIYVSEIPSARLRAMNVALAAGKWAHNLTCSYLDSDLFFPSLATQWLFNFVVARSVTTMLATMGKGGYGTYFLFGSFCYSMFIFVWFLIPETKGLSLESMDDLFGVTELVKDKLEHEEAATEHLEERVHQQPKSDISKA